MKILKSAPFLLFSAVFAAGLSLPAAADDTGEVKIISRQIERNLERVTPRSQGTRAVFNNNFQPRTKAKSNRKFNEGPIFGDNDCTRRTCGGAHVRTANLQENQTSLRRLRRSAQTG